MPVPSVITDLSTTAGSNSPAGTDSIGTNMDDYVRALSAFIAQVRDGSKNLELGTATAPALAFTSDSNTGIYSSAADKVSVTAGGTKVADFVSTGIETTGNVTAQKNLISGSTGQYGYSAYRRQSDGANLWQAGCDSSSASANFQIYNLGVGGNGILVAGTTNYVTMPYQASFRATNSSSETTSTSTFDTYTETYDQGSNFNHSTGAFVAPVAGVYMLVLDWQCSLSSSGQVEVQIYNSTTATALAYGEFSLGSAAGIIKQGAVIALTRLAASDSVIARTGTVTNGTGYINVFSGHLLG
jgi:C1q domain